MWQLCPVQASWVLWVYISSPNPSKSHFFFAVPFLQAFIACWFLKPPLLQFTNRFILITNFVTKSGIQTFALSPWMALLGIDKSTVLYSSIIDSDIISILIVLLWGNQPLEVVENNSLSNQSLWSWYSTLCCCFNKVTVLVLLLKTTCLRCLFQISIQDLSWFEA